MVYTGFPANVYLNTYQDMYQGGLQKESQLAMAVRNMSRYDFDGAGNLIFMPQSDVTIA